MMTNTVEAVFDGMLFDDEEFFLSGDTVEQYLNSVDQPAPRSGYHEEDPSPHACRTTPLPFGKDGGASNDWLENYEVPENAETIDRREITAEHCPDFQQLGVESFNNAQEELNYKADGILQLEDVNAAFSPAAQAAPNASDTELSAKEVLTDREMERRKRRRESNKRAAAKSRIKKKQENEKMQQVMQKLIDENIQLKEKLSHHQHVIQNHLKSCKNLGDLRDLLS